MTRYLLEQGSEGIANKEVKEVQENRHKLTQMKTVLEMYGHFSGINRKVQMRSLNDKRHQEILSNKFKGKREINYLLFIFAPIILVGLPDTSRTVYRVSYDAGLGCILQF